jgi:GMP synthase-like glutamine amidotransferase
MKKVYIVNGGVAYHTMFRNLGFAITSNMREAQLVCFTGGADVSPAFYGDKPHPYTSNSPERDYEEREIFRQALEAETPMVGICRGGQFLNVMSGGRMYQHIEGHGRSHNITDLQTGEVVYVSSTHHQMMMPAKNGVLVASSGIGGNREWYEGDIFKKDISDEDIEVVYYPPTNCLCFQPHPEFEGVVYEPMTAYFSKCIATYLEV